MKILVNDKLAEEAIIKLKDAGFEVDINKREPDKLAEDIKDFDGILIRSGTKVTTEVVKKGAEGNLKVIGRAGIGVDNIDIKTAGKKKIPVVNSPTGATASVAEIAIGHMIALSRNIARADKTMKKGEWAKKKLKGNELNEKILGLIGTGNIGKYTAKLAQAFNMKVIGYDPFVSKEDMKKDGISKVENIDEIMEKSDYISLHIPHNPKTHHIVNRDMISKMKPTAYLINCARGGTVDEEALYDALKKGSIAGAALDVYETEPPENSPLFNLDNIILTPHLGASTKEGQIRAGTVCADQIIKVLKDQEPDFCVNKKFF